MSLHNKRHTRIDFKNLLDSRGNPSAAREEQQDLAIGISDAFEQPSEAEKNDIRHVGPVLGLSEPPRAPPAQRTRFPVIPLGRVKSASPWSTYQKMYGIRLGAHYNVVVAQQKQPSHQLVSIRQFPGHLESNQLRMLRQIRNTHFVAVHDVYRFKKMTHVVFEYMPVSLHEIARSRKRVEAVHLSAILGPLVIRGLVYLSEQGLQHGSLTSSNILVSEKGEVKIAGFESCRPIRSTDMMNMDITAIKHITEELMQGYASDGAAVNVAEPKPWLPSEALSFLADTTSALSVTELAKHPLLELPWKTDQLKIIVNISRLSAYMRWELCDDDPEDGC
ncbi:hypothetical protein E8E12_001076 [Didymella heteroderae]|uniref:Protein kinase domain-containing protein n=1 Tax=Didymella heteroderae TaxID=1769908 RepID=A0A9P4WFS8_9PLEO|nr:hypothetical protein E8E12_001076 [Didymella heteroderae]